MASSRLNFVDHPDGSFSCQSVYLPAGYDPRSHAHQNCRILMAYLDTIRTVAPPDGTDEDAEASRPTSDTAAHLHLLDEGEAFRMQRQYLPQNTGFRANSPAHVACMLAHQQLDRLNRAVTDALVRGAGEAIRRVVSKARINAVSGHDG